jgi:hypothetical protein
MLSRAAVLAQTASMSLCVNKDIHDALIKPQLVYTDLTCDMLRGHTASRTPEVGAIGLVGVGLQVHCRMDDTIGQQVLGATAALLFGMHQTPSAAC